MTSLSAAGIFGGMVEKLEQQGAIIAGCCWIDPGRFFPADPFLIDVCDRTLVVVHPDGNSHIRLHQQALPVKAIFLINDLRVGSQLQEDLYQLWLESQRRILPVTVHRDEGDGGVSGGEANRSGISF